jgi:hypothetical protein
VQLVKSWLDIALDPLVGNEKTSTGFWQRVHESYIGALGRTDRAPSAFHNRWRVIQRNVSKFCGAYTAIENRNESGKTYDDRVQDACALFEAQNEAYFVQLPHWLIL